MTNVLYENVLFKSTNTVNAGLTTTRTPADRWSDVFNVLDYGAIGDGNPSHAATNVTAIRAALAAMYTSVHKGGILFFPSGNYVVNDTIDIGNANPGSNFTSGIIRGAGRWSTYINGNLPNGFVFFEADGTNGPEEISNLSLVNSSTVIGSGALMFSYSSMWIENCNFSGMMGIYMPYNIFQASINNCIGGAGIDPVTGYTGSFGIAGFGCNIEGWRGSGSVHTAIQFHGTNTCTISGSSHEVCTAGLVVGLYTGRASHCTVSGNVLTVGGTLGTPNSAGPNQFVIGAEIFMQGVTTVADWGISPYDSHRCTILNQLTIGSYGAPFFDGTYTISRTLASPITVPVPCVSRFDKNMSGLTVESFETEATPFIMVVSNTSACTFMNCGGSSPVNQCIDAFGNTGNAGNTGIYIRGGCGSTTFISCAPNNNPTNASFYFDPNGSLNTNLTLINCVGQRLADNVTGTSSSISNGSGGAGTLLNVVSFTGSGPNTGERVTGTGVTAGTVITGNYLTETATISSYAYNSGTGLVTLTLAAPVTLPSGYLISVRNLNISGVNVNNTAIAASVASSATVTYNAGAGLPGGPPSGGGTLHLLTGAASVGTYRVNNSQLVTGNVLTILAGEDWIIPTANDAKTAVNLIGCNSSNLPAGYTSGLANGMARTFTSLPGQAGSNLNYPVQDGMQYDIIDCTTSTFLATAAGGGSGSTAHRLVRYNAAAAIWQVIG